VIINVAQQVSEDWVLELMGHDGYAANISMHPGDMIIYESHSIIHGRPYPLNGQFYANCFFHFEPIGYSDHYFHNKKNQPYRKTTEDKFNEALAKQSGRITLNSLPTESMNEKLSSKKKLPSHVIEGTIEALRWRQEFDFHRVALRHENDDNLDEIFPMIIQRKTTGTLSSTTKTIGATSAHILAAKNDIGRLREVGRTDPKSLDTPDINGWLPIHEAARGGCTEVVRYLLEEHGISDINARTNNGKGGTPLWWAEHVLPANHDVIKILKRNGAVSIPPYQKKKKNSKNMESTGDRVESK
jgi:prolyl 4-hydroxylase